ncbi:metallophosphoesterase [Sphaerisporangium perillae]|uniref:metallophosphoesterase n=1 Tax=Sphaerisporangium perillae TaxID=2935860 RepID=UPI00200D0350|nr:metallophosphoesterase [Sphaerisporangium perillae]
MRKSLLAATVIAASLAGGIASPGIAAADSGHAGTTSDRGRSFTFALLGDTPYGAAQEAAFPLLVDDVNSDRDVKLVLHAGDVKSGSTTCDDAHLTATAKQYQTFEDPFVLTPGDNDWTDCHRAAAGGFLPTERLEAFRRLFYPVAGRTLGRHPMKVETQARDQDHRDYLENVLFTEKRVVFATVHVVGSSNDLAPWGELPGGDRPEARMAEYEARKAAALDWIDDAFNTARRTHAPGVLLMMQAEPTQTEGFADIRERIVERSRAYGKPVLLVHGDEHVQEVEPNYAGVPGLTRLETFGDTASQWLRVTVDPKSPEVFSWERRTVPAA